MPDVRSRRQGDGEQRTSRQGLTLRSFILDRFTICRDQHHALRATKQLVRLWGREWAGAIVVEVSSSSSVVLEVSGILSIGIPILLHLAILLDNLSLEVLALSELDMGHQASKARKVLVTSGTAHVLLVGVHL